MSRIQDVLNKIESFLNSADQSDTPVLRRCAADYAEACSQLNLALEECRKLIWAGLPDDAQAVDRQVTPPYSERLRLLDFPGREKWCAFCREYGWAIPPCPDLETAGLLRATRTPSGNGHAALIAAWRRIARDGDATEKVRLLRRIIASAPPSAAMWRRNLTNVERGWVRELTARGDAAIAADDASALETVYRELVSPELTVPVEPAVTERFGAALAQYQKSEYRQRATELLEEIAVAYNDMNSELAGLLLEQWENFATAPNFEPTAAELCQIAEARSWVEKQAAAAADQRKFTTLEKQLGEELDGNAPLPAIERTYHALLSLELPIAPILAERVETARERWHISARQRHIRKCVYCAAGTLLLLLAVGGGIFLLQRERECREAETQMRRLLDAGNGDGALELYERLRGRSRMLAARPRLASLQAEATALCEQNQADHDEFNRRLKRAEELLTPEAVEGEEFSATAAILEKLSGGRTAEQLDRFQTLTIRRSELTAANRQRRDNAFLKACDALEARFTALADSDADPAQQETALRQLNQDRRKLFAESPQVTEKYRTARQEQFDIREKQLGAQLKNRARLRRLEEQLTQPGSFWDYTQAVEALSVEVPAPADGIRQKAIELLPVWRQCASNPLSGEILDDPVALREQLRAMRRTGTGPVLNDLERIAPPGIEQADPMALVGERLNRLEREVLGDSDLYELVFLDAAGNEFHFYSPEPPQLEQKSVSRTIKSIALKVSLLSGQEESALILKVSREGAENRFEPLPEPALPGVKLPPEFVALRDLNLKAPVFEKAAHYRFLEQMIRRLRAAKTFALVRREVELQLKRIQSQTRMNPYMRMVITRRLLELAAAFSPLCGTRCDEFDYRFERITAGRNWNWRNPAEAAAHPGEVREISETIAGLEIDQMFQEEKLLQELYRTSLLRGFTPVGIVRQEGETVTLHFFTPIGTHELWVFSQDKNGNFRTIALEDGARNGKLSADERAFCFPGQVIFAPADGASSVELAEALQKKAGELGCRINSWPTTWPENRRFRQ